MSTRPSSTKFWASYLNYSMYNANKVWRAIGGGVGLEYGPGSNSCAARVSYGLNYGGAPIRIFVAASMNFPDRLYEGRAGDSKRYIVSAEQMQVYLGIVWGNPNSTISTEADIISSLKGLKAGQCAIFAAKGHTGVLRSGYTDPYIKGYLPVTAWVLA